MGQLDETNVRLTLEVIKIAPKKDEEINGAQ